ncbi:MAG: hypothetical protein K5907_02175 [Treponema sp.]|nr:hypothetical protein [Treponema sp.]
MGCIIAALSSCENFLKAHEVKEQIEEAIEIANSSAITYFVTAQEGSGTVTPDQIRVKKKETFDLRFKPASDWKFICWEVINTTTGQVEENSIKFENPDQTETKAYVINPKEGLEIHAKCIQIPCVIDVEPKGTGYANSPIIIKFNIPMEAPEVTADDSLFNYTNLLLTYGDKKVSEYFEAPVFNEEKTVLKLVPKWQDLMAFIKKENVGSALIEISFTDKITVNQNGVELPVDTKGLAYSVNYIPVVETTPPVQYDYFVTRKQMTLESAQTITASEKFHFNNLLTTDDENLFFQNASNGIIYIYGRFYDKDSGVQSVVVTHKRSQDFEGHKIGEAAIETVYTSSSPDAQFTTVNNETRFCIKHKLDNGKEGEDADGAFLLDVVVKDACENSVSVCDDVEKTEEDKLSTITIIRKTGFWGGSYGYGNFSVGTNELNSVLNASVFNESNYKSLIKRISLSMELDETFDSTIALFGEKAFFSREDFEIECEYIGKNNKHGIAKFEPDSTITYLYQWNLNLGNDEYGIDSVSGLELLLRVKIPEIGIVKEVKYVYPSTEEQLLFDMTKTGTSVTINSVLLQKGGLANNWRIIDSANNVVAKASATNTFTYDSSKKYYILWREGLLYGEKKLIDFSSSTGGSVDEVQLKTPVLKKASEGYLNCIIPLAMENNPWNYYDLIKVVYSGSSDFSVDPSTLYITKGNDSVSFGFKDDSIYTGKSWYIKAYGFKDSVWSDASEVKTVSAITGANDSRFKLLDNSLPVLSSDVKGGKITFAISDSETGIKSAKIKLLNGKNNGKGEELSFDENNKCEILWQKLMPSSTEPVVIQYEISDNAEPANKIEDKIDIFKFISPESYDKIKIIKTLSDGSVKVKETILPYYGGTPDLMAFSFNETDKCFPAILTYDEGTSLSYGNDNIDWGKNLECEYTISKSELSKVSSKYVKISSRDCGSGESWFTPFYCYNGAPGTGENDFLMQNENSSDSVVISSDKPVFVHTVVSEMPYEVCKNWDYSEWEYYKLSLNEKILDFGKPTTEDPNKNLPKRYVIPVSDNQIKSGDCYVVIAHFSDNHVEMSRVMVK